MKKVCIVILNYMTYEMSIDIVKQLRDLGFSEAIIVVDNNSNNESYEELQKVKDLFDIVLLKSTRNVGYAAGNNLGILWAQENGYKSILIMNNDIEIKSLQDIYAMYDLMSTSDTIGCVCPRILDSNLNEVAQNIYRPTLYSWTIGIFSCQKKAMEITKSSHDNFKIYRAHGCCMMLSQNMIAKIGLLDERTFLYFEEEILAENMLKQGYTTYCCTDAVVIHNHSVTTSKFINKFAKVKIYWKSQNIYMKFYRNWNLLKRLPCCFIKGLSVFTQ